MTSRTSHARSALLGGLVAAAVLVGAGTNFVARKHLSLYEDEGSATHTLALAFVFSGLLTLSSLPLIIVRIRKKRVTLQRPTSWPALFALDAGIATLLIAAIVVVASSATCGKCAFWIVLMCGGAAVMGLTTGAVGWYLSTAKGTDRDSGDRTRPGMSRNPDER